MQTDGSNNIILIISLFNLGFFGGFGHCIGMCGPFVLSQVSMRLQNIAVEGFTGFSKLKGLMLLPYHFGRITTYSFIGFLVSLLSKNVKEFTNIKYFSAFLLILAAIIFLQKAFEGKILIRIPLLNKFFTHFSFIFRKFSNKFRPKILDKLFRNPEGLNGYLLGIILGFIPCGLLYGAFVVCATISNPFLAAFGMFLFGIATIPALFSASFGGYVILKTIGKSFNSFARLVILINSATLFIIGISLLLK